MPPFRWEDIDHSLVGLRLTELAIEMHDRIRTDEARIQFENRNNLNSNAAPSLVLKMKQQSADEWAQRVYEIYCDVWQKQGCAKCAAFLRAVSARAIVPTLRARKGTIAAEFSAFATRTSFPSTIRDATLQAFQLDMQRLEDRWRRRLEIEAKECEHAERREKMASARISSSAIPSIDAAQKASRSDKSSPQGGLNLGPKKQDLSRYLDSAKLTQRQRDCMSFQFEYELKLSEIAHRLGIDRKTVEEHLALAKTKLERQTARERGQKHFTKVKPGNLDM